MVGECQIPTVYRQFFSGLVRPTWEPEARMREQLPESHRDSPICWYGHADGRVEARVHHSERVYTSHMFIRRGEDWLLTESLEEIVID